jgi:hypothetical protein
MVEMKLREVMRGWKGTRLLTLRRGYQVQTDRPKCPQYHTGILEVQHDRCVSGISEKRIQHVQPRA